MRDCETQCGAGDQWALLHWDDATVLAARNAGVARSSEEELMRGGVEDGAHAFEAPRRARGSGRSGER